MKGLFQRILIFEYLDNGGETKHIYQPSTSVEQSSSNDLSSPQLKEAYDFDMMT